MADIFDEIDIAAKLANRIPDFVFQCDTQYLLCCHVHMQNFQFTIGDNDTIGYGTQNLLQLFPIDTDFFYCICQRILCPNSLRNLLRQQLIGINNFTGTLRDTHFQPLVCLDQGFFRNFALPQADVGAV